MSNSYTLKFFLYDWTGYNKTISESIHSNLAYESLTGIFRLITEIGNFYLFPLVLGLLLTIFFIQLRGNKSSAMLQGILYARSIALLILNLTICAVIVELTKNFFHYPRPYCFYGFDISKYMLQAFIYPVSACNHSFPSGHATYITLLVASLWSILNKNLRIAGTALIILVGVSRVVLGKHFIADVIYGYALAMLLINPLGKALIAKYFLRFEPIIKNIIKKFVIAS